MRFFFNMHDKLRIQDELGREFAAPSEAVVFAKHLAADLRCLETAIRPSLAKWSPKTPDAFTGNWYSEAAGRVGASVTRSNCPAEQAVSGSAPNHWQYES